jgi:hypothetical protein
MGSSTFFIMQNKLYRQYFEPNCHSTSSSACRLRRRNAAFKRLDFGAQPPLLLSVP